MPRDWKLNEESFETLLAWLDADREVAGQKYEAIRRQLIRIFHNRKCQNPEELADENINRVAAKVKEISGDYKGNPEAYFYGVAQNIAKEAQRRKPELSVDPELISQITYNNLPEEDSAACECSKKCLENLPPDDKQLFKDYFLVESKNRIDSHHKLATNLGITANALRVRAHRIRKRLKKCVKDCLGQAE